MNHFTSNRASVVKASATSKNSATLMRQAGVIIDLAQGEAEDLFTPEHVKEAAQQAMRDNRTKYTPTAGIPELREAIAERLLIDNGIRVDAAQVVTSAGAKQSIFNFMLATLNPGDEVLVPAPYWLSFPYQIELAGGRAVIVPTSSDTGFKVTGDIIRRYLGPKTRAIILNSPNNPSGVVYTREELLNILDVTLPAKLLVLSDEVYDRLTYDGVKHVSVAALGQEAAEMTVTVNSVSKRYCMTGWRLGFAAGPPDIISAMERIQSHSTSSPNSVAQWASLAALTGNQNAVSQVRDELQKRREYVVEEIHCIPDLRCNLPAGGFFAFPSVTRAEPTQFPQALLEATGVTVMSGAPFGMVNHVRICFAASWTSLRQGMENMSTWLNNESANRPS